MRAIALSFTNHPPPATYWDLHACTHQYTRSPPGEEVLPTCPFHREARGGGAQVLVRDAGLEQRIARSCWRPSSL